MAPRKVSPFRFFADGRVIDWEAVFADRPGEPVDVHVVLKNLGLKARMLHLRWAFNADAKHVQPPMGMPTEPFQVWRQRERDFSQVTTDLPYNEQHIGNHLTAYSWGIPATHVRVAFDPSTPAGTPVV